MMDNAMVGVRFFVMALSLTTFSCNAQEGAIKRMESAEKAANERARNELVAYMSLETMFPEPQVRALAEAAGKGKIKQIEALVQQGVDVKARGTSNATPLFWAMHQSNIKGFARLLELGADPNVVFDDGGTVMHWAVWHKSEAFLKAALAHGGDPNLKAGQFSQTPLFEALGERRDRIDLLLDAGADVNVQESLSGMTPIMLAAGRGSFDVVYKLLNHGADYTIKNNGGHTLADMIADVRSRMDPKHELYDWMKRDIQWLEEHGIQVQ